MARRKPSRDPQPIGEILRARRVEKLNKGLREMARFLQIAPAHLTDIENGRRNPSDDLLVKLAHAYGISEATLRAGFIRPTAEVVELVSDNAVAVEKVPQFLRSAKELSGEQWDRLIHQAKKMASEKREAER